MRTAYGTRLVPATRIIDVGVVTWNTAELTARALRTTLDGDRSDLIRAVLVHDNASTDGTPELLSEDVPEADVEVAAGNLGFARGVNRIIERSTAPWLLLLNSDAWPEPGALDLLVSAADTHPDAAAVAPRLQRLDGSLEDSTHPFPSLRVAMATAVGLHGRVQWDHDRSRYVDWAVGAALLIRREALDAIGDLDERYFMYSEDIDWCWRARRAGWRIWFEHEAVFLHVGNASGAERFGDSRDAVIIANARRFYRGTHSRAETLAWLLLNATGTLRLAATSRLHGDRTSAARWRRQARAYLSQGR